jgi:hypothetical protein
VAASRYGADWSKARPTAAMLSAHGISFACRYLLDDARDRGKGLKLAEAQWLSGLGVELVANFEYATEPLLTRDQGVRDGRTAAAELARLGAPPHVPVYFSFDYDAPNSDYPGMYDYLRGAESVLGIGRAGAYGKYAVVEYLAGRGIHWLWQTYAWSAGRWSARATIRQVRNGAFGSDFDGDLDQAMVDDFGQWTLTPQETDMMPSDDLTPLGDLARFFPPDLNVTPATVWTVDYALKLGPLYGASARVKASEAKGVAAEALGAAKAADATAVACRDAIGALAAGGTSGAAIDYDVLAGKLAPLVAALVAADVAARLAS